LNNPKAEAFSETVQQEQNVVEHWILRNDFARAINEFFKGNRKRIFITMHYIRHGKLVFSLVQNACAFLPIAALHQQEEAAAMSHQHLVCQNLKGSRLLRDRVHCTVSPAWRCNIKEQTAE